MTAETPPRPDVSVAERWPSSSLSVDVVDRADVVVRVLSVMHRRKCRLLTLEYEIEPNGLGQLRVQYMPPPRHGHRVAEWIENLVDVLGVRCSDPMTLASTRRRD